MFVVAQLQQELELLREELVVVLEVETEQRERVDEGATPDDHLRASLRDEIERRELLEQPYRIDRTQDRHRAREADALRARGRGSQDHRRGGVEEFSAMVFA